MRVILTRPQSQVGKWLDALRLAGHDAIALPLIEIGPAPDPQPVLQAWQAMARYDAVMFVSANAAEHFFALRPEGGFAPRAFVTGPGSLAALLAVGLDRAQIDAPDAAAGQFDSEALWSVVRQRITPGYRVLIVRGMGDDDATEAPGAEASGANGVGRDWFARQVQGAGGVADFVVAYQRRLPVLGANALALAQVASADGSVWLFSSSEAVTNLQSLCSGQRWSAARALVTHPRIAEAARKAGFGVVRESRPALTELLASIESMA